MRHLHHENHSKEISSLAKKHQSKHGFSLMFVLIHFFGHCDMYWHADNTAGQFQESKLSFHSDEKPLDMCLR